MQRSSQAKMNNVSVKTLDGKIHYSGIRLILLKSTQSLFNGLLRCQPLKNRTDSESSQNFEKSKSLLIYP